MNRLKEYTGAFFNYDSIISIEVIEGFVSEFSCGKAAGFDLLTAEHLKFCQPVVLCSLKLLFSLMVSVGYVPDAFGCGITVPLPKSSSGGVPSSVNEYRGITLLPVVSKLFECTLLKCMTPYLNSSSSQFGFKKGHSCSHAVFSVRKIVDMFSLLGSTVNICSVDISKAFDNLSHIKLFHKLLDRNFSVKLILVLIAWYAKMEICVKWGAHFLTPSV
jgi:hypothetical protein